MIIWAFVGIAANQSSNQLIVALLLACVVVIIIALAMSIRHSRSKLVTREHGKDKLISVLLGKHISLRYDTLASAIDLHIRML